MLRNASGEQLLGLSLAMLEACSHTGALFLGVRNLAVQLVCTRYVYPENMEGIGHDLNIIQAYLTFSAILALCAHSHSLEERSGT